jgi:hypothetical protein
MLLKNETLPKEVALRIEFEHPGMREAADTEMRARKLCADIVNTSHLEI